MARKEQTRVVMQPLTFEQFVNKAAQRVTSPPVPGGGNASMRVEGRRDDWSGARTLEDGIALARNGWRDGVQTMVRGLGSVTAVSTVDKANFDLMPFGVMCSVPDYLAGLPDCMVFPQESPVRARAVAICVSSVYSGFVEGHQALVYGQGIVNVVQELEAQGITTAVYTVDVSGDGYGESNADRLVLSAVAVRELGQPFDISRIASAVHPAWLRRLAFAYRELHEEYTPGHLNEGSYGYPCGLTEASAREALKDSVSTDTQIIVLPALNDVHSHCTSLATIAPLMQEHVRTELKKATGCDNR